MYRKIIPITFLILLLAVTFLFLINVQPVEATYSGGVIRINIDGSVSPANAPITRNGDVYTLTDNVNMVNEGAGFNVLKSNIILDGAGYTLDGELPPNFYIDVGEWGIAVPNNAYNVTIKNFIIKNFLDYGIMLNSARSLVFNNTLLNCNGILVSASNCSVIGNKLDSGINLGSMNNTTVAENTIVSQEAGGLYTNQISSGNRIFHNNFLINCSISNCRTGDLSPNMFDNNYPSGGNFWNDYEGTDFYHGPYQNITGSDGIGDTPYTVKLKLWNGTRYVYGVTNFTDRYPLLQSYSTFTVNLSKSNTVKIGTTSNSTLTNFNLNEIAKTLSFNVNGSNNTFGFCRLILPNDLIQNLWNNNYKILLDNKEIAFTNNSDNDFTYIYINYTHSTHTITIISTIVVPEFSSTLILPLFIIITLLISIIYFKKHTTGR